MGKNDFLPRGTVSEHAASFKALGDDTRIRMIGLLTLGELCVCDLMEVLELPQSTVSRHLAYLKNCWWIVGRRSGKWMHYKLNPELQRSPVHLTIVTYIGGLADLKYERERLVGYLERKNQTKCS